jgi:hypothetical protein
MAEFEPTGTIEAQQARTKDRDGSSGLGLLGLGLAACGVLAVVGLILTLTDTVAERRMVGVALLTCGVGCALLSLPAYAVLLQLQALRRQREEIAQAASAKIDTLAGQLALLADQQLISDRAKSVAFRDRDREALRRAISEEVLRADWDAARALIDDMDLKFGYRAEAERLRATLSDQRLAGVRKLFEEARERIDRLCRGEDWTGAQHEASKFISTHADFEPARRLPGEIESRRQLHKKQLMDRWADCVARHDSDAGIDVLRQLDPYLTPAEGERLAESARSIFNDRKAKLRDQLSGAVAAKNWWEAIRVAESIQREFPNAKFAQEAADALPELRARANEAQPETPALQSAT